MSLTLLTTENLGCQYNGMTVLREVSFRVQAGDYLGIVGPIGSRKSNGRSA